MAEISDFRAQAFRRHRHDVLNELQLIRANIQLNRPARAIELVDRTAQWLQSLAVWQNVLTDPEADLLWIAASCPRIVLREVLEGVLIEGTIASSLRDLLPQADDAASQSGSRLELVIGPAENSVARVRLEIRVTGDADQFSASTAEWRHTYSNVIDLVVQSNGEL